MVRLDLSGGFHFFGHKHQNGIPFVNFSVAHLLQGKPRNFGSVVKGTSHPEGPPGSYTQWVKEANPDVGLKHKQCRNITTSEPGTLELEPLSLG